MSDNYVSWSSSSGQSFKGSRIVDGNIGPQGDQGEKGEQGDSAYEIAVQEGFVGTEEEWLKSLEGKSAYEVAVENGYEGTEEQWVDEHLSPEGYYNKKQVDSKNSNLQSQISVNKARIDNLSTLEEGSTTGDAELIDIRIGADGKQYENAGEAVRSQILQLNKFVENISDIIEPNNRYDLEAITENKVISNSGSIIDSTTTFVTDFIPVKKDDTVYITYINSSNVFTPISSAVCFNYAVYDADMNLLDRSNYSNSIEITDNDAKWIRFTFNNALLNCVISLTINQYPSSASQIQEYFEPYFIPKEPLAQELQQEIENIETRKGTLKIVKTTTTIDIYIPINNSDNFMHFTYSYISNNSINMNQWRMNHAEVVDKNFTRIFELASGIEWDGVVKESNTDDFIGGYHGDETNQYINILADGVQMDSTTSSSWEIDNIVELKIVNKSVLNRCNTPNDNLFTRYKVHTFNRESVQIFNRWIALQNVTLQYSYLSMMGMKEFDSNNYPIGKYARNNDNFIIQQNPGEAISGGPLSNSFFADTMEFWNDEGFYASVQSIPNYESFGSSQEHAVRLDRSQTDTAKAYFSYLRSNTQIPQDRELVATSILKFMYNPIESEVI